MKIGDTIWRFNNNRRVYKEGRSTPIYREHWIPSEITGETTRSWIIGMGYGEYKIPKKGAHHGFAFTQQEVDDDCYVKENLYRISRTLEYVRDANILRQVASLIGYMEQK